MSGSRPGRVVMLVDNTIDGDSRVQKSARAMAEAGWEVHLIGRAPASGPDTYQIGDAQIHRLSLKRLPPRTTLRKRVAKLRYPLAYKNQEKALLKTRTIKVQWAELEMSSAGPDARTGIARSPRTTQLPLLAQRTAGRLRRGAIKARVQQTKHRAANWGDKDGAWEEVERRFWSSTMGDRAWRRLDPLPLRYELSYRDKIEELRPDLIHAHDFRMIGVAARAAVRARRAGHNVRVVYDAHEFVPGLAQANRSKKWLASQVAYEREHIGYVDAIVTVSPALAEMLETAHGLAERPIVTLNAPPKLVPGADDGSGWTTPEGARDVRDACGLGPDTPLAVYCGGAAPQRCLHTIVESLQYSQDIHAAFMINNLDGDYVNSLRELAAGLGVSERIHLMPYVPYDVLVRFLSTADVGIHPLRKGPVNHEVALSTKFFEFMQARLPVVVSDVKAMSDEVTRVGNGEVFRSEDAKDLARAVGLVLDDRDRYTQPYDRPGMLDEWSWEAQAEKYVVLYEKLLKDLA
ncbi:glycosyltransferase family 4 protein [Streptomyces halstedii]|uniref:glycosyltransferase family 4 protein n=1 Tax=Streptomyces TaxID=1883 RepID=UPI0015E182B0|nr:MULTISPECIES: glycosyltransferase family 4 protein [unclassified Streptomyces]